MKILKCKNCGGEIEWRAGTGEIALAHGGVSLTIGCPSCRQNVVYGLGEVVQFTVDEPNVNDVEDTNTFRRTVEIACKFSEDMYDLHQTDYIRGQRDAYNNLLYILKE